MKRNLLFILFCLCLTAMAQSPTGTFVGRVWDSSAAAIPGATVTAQNLGTGQKFTVTSGSAGDYVIYSAPPGRYTLKAETQGFKSGVVSEVQMTVGSSVRADFTLEVGAIEQRVEVTARAELQTESAAVENLVTNEQIVNMPLNGRDFNQLVLLSPGAVDNTLNSGQDFGSYALNGNRSFSNDFQLDGVPNNNLFQGKSAMSISIDAIREFKVLSADSSAEFGQAGAQIMMVTQSGTNKFHGSLYEFNRTNHLQARDPFNTIAIQPFTRNQFGGSLGGPIRRNSTFFFFNYEGNRQYENVTRFSFLPPDAFWKGDFSALLPRIQLRDPLTVGRPNIPGNRLDQYLGGALISKTALKLQPFYGSPDSNALTNNTLRFPQKTTIGDQFTIRIDQQLPRNTTLSARTTYGNTGGFKPNLVGTPAVGYTEPLRSRNGSLALSTTVGPRTVNEFRFGAMNFSDIAHYIDGGLPTVQSLGLQGFQIPGENEKDWIPPMPRIVFSGNDAFTPIKYGETSDYGEAALSMINNVFTYSDTFRHQRGAHSMRAGMELRRTLLNVLQQTNARGQLTFSGANNNNSTGYSFADFLMGLPASSQQVALKPKALLKQLDFAGFYQDDWKVSSRLTLNMGIRYELFLNPYEIRNRFSNFDPKTGAIVVASNNGQPPTSEYNQSLMAALTNPDGTLRFPLLTDKQAGFTARRLVDTQKKNFAPRFGFTYLVGKKSNTVVRGGYGIFYTRYPRQYLLQTMLVNPPFAGLLTFSQTITNGTPRITLDAPYSAGSSPPSVAPLGLQRNFLLPDNQQWNFTIQRDIGWKTVLTLGYIGNKGTHLFRTINLNGPIPDPNKPGAAMRLYSATYGTSSVNYRITDATSIYNSMRVEARKTLSSGLTFQSNWTWAKGLDTTGTNVNAAILDMENRGRDRADSDYVRRHIITTNAQYRLPFGRSGRFLKSAGGWQNAFLSGWQVGGIWRYQTGQYLTPTFSQSNALSNNRPDRVLGVPANLPRGQRTPQRWFNPAAFAIPPVIDPVTGDARFGNCGRNVVEGPGLSNMDLAMYKTFPLGKSERRNITFRFELFNAMNHPNWGNPDMAITNTNTVATINRVTVAARQAQFALRFDF